MGDCKKIESNVLKIVSWSERWWQLMIKFQVSTKFGSDLFEEFSTLSKDELKRAVFDLLSHVKSAGTTLKNGCFLIVD